MWARQQKDRDKHFMKEFTYHISVEFPGCHLDEVEGPDDNHCKSGTLWHLLLRSVPAPNCAPVHVVPTTSDPLPLAGFSGP